MLLTRWHMLGSTSIFSGCLYVFEKCHVMYYEHCSSMSYVPWGPLYLGFHLRASHRWPNMNSMNHLSKLFVVCKGWFYISRFTWYWCCHFQGIAWHKPFYPDDVCHDDHENENDNVEDLYLESEPPPFLLLSVNNNKVECWKLFHGIWTISIKFKAQLTP